MKTEYISREAAVKAIIAKEKREIENDFAFNEGLIVASNTVAEIPAADVVEVVRCRDCKFYVAGRDRIDCSLMRFYLTYPGDYCSRGERRIKDGKG